MGGGAPRSGGAPPDFASHFTKTSGGQSDFVQGGVEVIKMIKYIYDLTRIFDAQD